jgi:hypothetical protein
MLKRDSMWELIAAAAAPRPLLLQNLSLKEDKVRLSNKEDKIAIKEEQKCESEQEALQATAAGTAGDDYRR